ncbi:hypothetical protein C4580_00890 [Candidatus Woesearchaeota archaeon]|nr:MAG: hypothetical protein C4580_00890 [Candidatus Woesearchaeota archaeon]
MFHVVSSCFTDFLYTAGGSRKSQATIHEYAKGAKSPLATHFSWLRSKSRRKVLFFVLVALVLGALAFWFSPFWNAEVIVEEAWVQVMPQGERAGFASLLFIERLSEAEGAPEEDFRDRILAAQRLLSIVEENLDIEGRPYKVLRQLQEVDDALRQGKRRLEQFSPRSDEEELLIRHARLRVDILIEEVELAKQKNKAQLA